MLQDFGYSISSRKKSFKVHLSLLYVLQNVLKAFYYCPFSWPLSCTDKLSCLRRLVSSGRAIEPPICQQAETHSPPRLQCVTALPAWMSACISSGPFPAKYIHIHTLRLAVLIGWLEHTGSWASSVIIISIWHNSWHVRLKEEGGIDMTLNISKNIAATRKRSIN